MRFVSLYTFFFLMTPGKGLSVYILNDVALDIHSIFFAWKILDIVVLFQSSPDLSEVAPEDWILYTVCVYHELCPLVFPDPVSSDTVGLVGWLTDDCTS